MQTRENEIEELAKILFKLDYPNLPNICQWGSVEYSYKNRACGLIEHGYHRTNPSLIPLDRFNIRNLLTEYFEYDAAYGYQASLESLDGIIESFLNLGQPRSLSMGGIEEIMHKSFFKSMRKMNPYDAKHIKCYAKAIHDLLTKGVK